MTTDVFISYSSKDRHIAEVICRALERNGVPCWIAPRDITPGTEYAKAIVDTIGACRVFILVFSSSADQSAHVLRELDCAVGGRKVILPFRIENLVPSAPMQYYLSSTHWLDALTPLLDSHVMQLLDVVLMSLGRSRRRGRLPGRPGPWAGAVSDCIAYAGRRLRRPRVQIPLVVVLSVVATALALTHSRSPRLVGHLESAVKPPEARRVATTVATPATGVPAAHTAPRTTPAVAAQGWSTYRNAKAGYSLRYPHGWAAERHEPGVRDVLFLRPRNTENTSIEIDVMPQSASGPGQQWEASSNSFRRKYGVRYQLGGLGQGKLGSLDCAVWEFSLANPDGSIVLRKRDYGLYIGGRSYSVLCTAPRGDFGRWQHDFDRSIASFQILGR